MRAGRVSPVSGRSPRETLELADFRARVAELYLDCAGWGPTRWRSGAPARRCDPPAQAAGRLGVHPETPWGAADAASDRGLRRQPLSLEQPRCPAPGYPTRASGTCRGLGAAGREAGSGELDSAAGDPPRHTRAACPLAPPGCLDGQIRARVKRRHGLMASRAAPPIACGSSTSAPGTGSTRAGTRSPP